MDLYRAVVLSGLALFFGGCATVPPAPPAMPQIVQAPPPPADGSIYHASNNIALFEDVRARRAGDTLTVLLVERTSAQKKAATSTSKESSTNLGNPTLFGRPLSVGGVPVGAFGLDSSQDFEGTGDSSQSNQLSGSVSVIVTEVLANGLLAIQGEKQVSINQGTETIRISGLVRASDVLSNNTVTSDRIANARIAYGGSGAIADSNTQGWLARFFASGNWPF